MLTTPERQRLTQVLSSMKPEARVLHIARLRRVPGKAAEVSVLEGIHQQLCFAEQAAATPLEVNGRYRQTSPQYAEQPRIEYAPYWTPERVKYLVYSVGGIAGIGAGIYYVVIPATIAAVSALISVVPYIAGAVAALVILRELFTGGTGEKKTDSYPAEIPRNSAGNVYNVYIGEGQVHVHQTGEK